jgi:hypothetical protein
LSHQVTLIVFALSHSVIIVQRVDVAEEGANTNQKKKKTTHGSAKPALWTHGVGSQNIPKNVVWSSSYAFVLNMVARNRTARSEMQATMESHMAL